MQNKQIIFLKVFNLNYGWGFLSDLFETFFRMKDNFYLLPKYSKNVFQSRTMFSNDFVDQIIFKNIQKQSMP